MLPVSALPSHRRGIDYAQALARARDRTRAIAELERLLVHYPKFPESAAAMALLTDLRKSSQSDIRMMDAIQSEDVSEEFVGPQF